MFLRLLEDRDGDLDFIYKYYMRVYSGRLPSRNCPTSAGVGKRTRIGIRRRVDEMYQHKSWGGWNFKPEILWLINIVAAGLTFTFKTCYILSGKM